MSNSDIYKAQKDAQTLLTNFASNILKEKKLVTKTYSYNFQLYNSGIRQGLARFFTLLKKEFLKRNPYIRETVYFDQNQTIDLVIPQIQQASISIYLSLDNLQEIKLIQRYIRIKNRKLILNNLPGSLILENHTLYNGWSSLCDCHVLTFSFTNPSVDQNFNPYKYFLFIEELLGFTKTISKYIPVLIKIPGENRKAEIHPLYTSLKAINRLNNSSINKDLEDLKKLKVKKPKKTSIGGFAISASPNTNTSTNINTTTTTTTGVFIE